MSYLIPIEATRHEIVVDKSRFIASVCFTPDYDSAQNFIKQIRQEMPDASHHVYAFRIGYGKTVLEGMSDDGEPQGTSAPPTLAVLRGSNIGDITLVTTRYFGGKKLGTGGLVRAYTAVAQLVLKDVKTDFKILSTIITVYLSYSVYEQAKYRIKSFSVLNLEETFTTEVRMVMTVDDRDVQSLIACLTELSSGQARFEYE